MTCWLLYHISYYNTLLAKGKHYICDASKRGHMSHDDIYVVITNMLGSVQRLQTVCISYSNTYAIATNILEPSQRFQSRLSYNVMLVIVIWHIGYYNTSLNQGEHYIYDASKRPPDGALARAPTDVAVPWHVPQRM